MSEETKAPAKSREALIKEKISAGLTREQAIDVTDRQVGYESPAARPEKKTAKDQ